MHRGMRNAYKNLVEYSEEKRPLASHRHIWDDNIKMDLEEVGCEVVDWSHLTEDMYQWQALISTVMNLWVS
jgi:hypothetical protein